MSDIKDVLSEIKKKINDEKELSYFLIHEDRYKITLKRIQKICQGKEIRILDIGCFPYHIGAALEKLGHDVFGIASYHEQIKNKRISILNIEEEKFPYEDSYFDLVLFNEIIEHLPYSPIPALKEIFRVTKKNGLVMITTPNITRSINRAKLFLGKNIMYPIDVYFEENGRGNNIYHRHNREYILKELITLLEKTGWNVIEKDYFVSYTPFRKKAIIDPWWLNIGKQLNYLLMLIFPSLQDTLFILGRK